jgi:hypothetical protein
MISGPGTWPSPFPLQGPLGIKGRWKLVLNSTFSGAMNTDIWSTGWFGAGITGPADSFESTCYSPANVAFPDNGTMSLSLSLQPSTCKFDGIPVTEPDTGAAVTTDPNDGRASGGFEYTYGVLEARLYLPGQHGLIVNWPGVWTTSQTWPVGGEDDIVEGLGGHACYHFHNALPSTGGGPGGCDMVLKPGWHTFASDWQPGSVSYYYDGKLIGRLTKGITDSPQYIVIQNTTGDEDWNSPTQPASMLVRYVRVWQKRQ